VNASSFDPKLSGDPLLPRVLNDAAAAQGTLQKFRADRLLDKERLFDALEGGNGGSRRLIAYLTAPGPGGIDLFDAAPLGSMLDAIGTCDQLDLMLNSPGGYGESAEKIIEMCREHCRKEFRVIVPNFAKSAATMIALGADVIVMGYLSELGPIDPQYTVAVAGVEQSVSGQSFIAAYDGLQEQVAAATAAGVPPTGFWRASRRAPWSPRSSTIAGGASSSARISHKNTCRATS
jgi:hypothetical protein